MQNLRDRQIVAVGKILTLSGNSSGNFVGAWIWSTVIQSSKTSRSLDSVTKTFSNRAILTSRALDCNIIDKQFFVTTAVFFIIPTIAWLSITMKNVNETVVSLKSLIAMSLVVVLQLSDPRVSQRRIHRYLESFGLRSVMSGYHFPSYEYWRFTTERRYAAHAGKYHVFNTISEHNKLFYYMNQSLESNII